LAIGVEDFRGVHLVDKLLEEVGTIQNLGREVPAGTWKDG